MQASDLQGYSSHSANGPGGESQGVPRGFSVCFSESGGGVPGVREGDVRRVDPLG
jgi:hypothetical protein